MATSRRFTKIALQVELLRHGIMAELERRLTVRFKGVVVGDYDADLMVANAVLVELKNRVAIRQARRCAVTKRTESLWNKIRGYSSTSDVRRLSLSVWSSESVSICVYLWRNSFLSVG